MKRSLFSALAAAGVALLITGAAAPTRRR